MIIVRGTKGALGFFLMPVDDKDKHVIVSVLTKCCTFSCAMANKFLKEL